MTPERQLEQRFMDQRIASFLAARIQHDAATVGRGLPAREFHRRSSFATSVRLRTARNRGSP